MSDDEATETRLRLPRPPGAARDASATAVRARRGAWWAVTAALVLGGIAAAVLAARSVAQSDHDRARLGFHLSSDEIAATLKLAIQHEEDLVDTASALVASNERISPLEFDRWAQLVHAFARYPELENIGLVKLVPASQLHAFEAMLARRPLEPLGPHTAGVNPPFSVIPLGSRPFYCFAVAGLSRTRATYLPPGLDYCALASSLVPARDAATGSYAPFVNGSSVALGVQTPVYRHGAAPASVAGRRSAFVGWLGELLVPDVVLSRALAGHANTAVRFSYSSGVSHVSFRAGHAPAHAQTASIDLHNGWTVQSAGPAAPAGVTGDPHALTLLVGGSLLSLLVGLLVVVLATSRTRALSLVREKTSELSHQALHDTLTGLPNRALVLDHAWRMLTRVARRPDTLAGALFVDIDGFKHVNDRFGHAAGDRLLRVVGERLQGAVRGHDTVGRLGGDEFVLLVETPAHGAQLEELADRLIDSVRQSVELEDGRLFSVTASIGLTAGRYATPDELLRDADLALYAAKAAGKDRYVLFDASVNAEARGRVELERDLSAALREQQLVLHYQPIFDLATHRVVALEALVRWRHPTHGLLAPGQFIPIAEQNGMIVPIGRWVLEQACAHAERCRSRGRPVGVSVNVSASQLARRSFPDDVRRALRNSGLPASLLTLEVTETALMRDVDLAGERLAEVKALSVGVAIDDFGTGYASLSNLRRMPADVLKVDRSFIAALQEGDRSRELLEAILGVARALSLSVVAEGIELPEQLAALEELGCEMGQGFLLGRPAAAEESLDLLELGTPSSATA